MQHFTLEQERCTECGYHCEICICEPIVSDDPYGGDDSRADADLLGERDGWDEPDDDHLCANFLGEEP